jgi:histidinol phosphatase-like enzyme
MKKVLFIDRDGTMIKEAPPTTKSIHLTNCISIPESFNTWD